MNLKNKPYTIWGHSKKSERKGVWFSVRSFETMAQAMQSLHDLTKVSKDKRDIIYIVLPNNGEKRRYILFKDEYADNVIDSAK